MLQPNSTSEPAEQAEQATPLVLPPGVKPDFFQQLVEEFGFSRERAIKALIKTQREGSLEAAVLWLTENEDSEEVVSENEGRLVERELKLLSTEDTRTPEELQKQADALQKRIREKAAKRQKEEEHERERQRIEMGRNMRDAAEALETAEKKRMLLKLQRDKKLHEEERQRQLECLRREWEERFGRPYPEDRLHADEVDEHKTPREKVAFWISKLRAKSNVAADREAVVVCLTTLQKYLSNISNDPENPKFRKIRRDNAAFVKRIVPFETEAVGLLRTVGFEERAEGTVLELPGVPDGFLISYGVKLLTVVLQQLGSSR